MSSYSRIKVYNLLNAYKQDASISKSLSINEPDKLERLETYIGCELFLENNGIYNYFQRVRPTVGKIIIEWIKNTENNTKEDIYTDFLVIVSFIGIHCKDLINDSNVLPVLPLAVKHLLIKFSESLDFKRLNINEVLNEF